MDADPVQVVAQYAHLPGLPTALQNLECPGRPTPAAAKLLQAADGIQTATMAAANMAAERAAGSLAALAAVVPLGTCAHDQARAAVILFSGALEAGQPVRPSVAQKGPAMRSLLQEMCMGMPQDRCSLPNVTTWCCVVLG